LWQISQALKQDAFLAGLAEPIDEALTELAKAESTSSSHEVAQHRKAAHRALLSAHETFARAAVHGMFVEEERIVGEVMRAIFASNPGASSSKPACQQGLCDSQKVPSAEEIQEQAQGLLQALKATEGQRLLSRQKEREARHAEAAASADKFTQQALSASVGAVLTSILVTPFEVVKVRQQAWVGAPPPAGTLVRQLAGTEGVSALWSGLRPGLIMSVPATILYLTAYERVRDEMSWRLQWPTEWSSFFAGGAARLVTSTVVSPLELLRTRMQATRAANAGGLLPMATALVRDEGVRSLWRGLVPTLWRDVPFSCMYWLSYEAIKRRVVESSPNKELPTSAAFAAGATSGTIAAFATTPLDVVKTRQQLQQQSPAAHAATTSATTSAATASSTASAATNMPRASAQGSPTATAMGMGAELLAIARAEGVGALFVGLGPRLAKVAPSCAIMIASYELGKRYLGELRVTNLAAAVQGTTKPTCLVSYIASCDHHR